MSVAKQICMNPRVSEQFWVEGFSAALKIHFAVLRKQCSTMRTQVEIIYLYFNMCYVL